MDVKAIVTDFNTIQQKIQSAQDDLNSCLKKREELAVMLGAEEHSDSWQLSEKEKDEIIKEVSNAPSSKLAVALASMKIDLGVLTGEKRIEFTAYAILAEATKRLTEK